MLRYPPPKWITLTEEGYAFKKKYEKEAFVPIEGQEIIMTT